MSTTGLNVNRIFTVPCVGTTLLTELLDFVKLYFEIEKIAYPLFIVF